MNNQQSLELMLEFQKIIKIINNEISCNRGSKYYFSIEQILIHNSPQELYSILKYCSPTYWALYNDSKYDNILCLLDFYVNRIYRYYDNILFSEQMNFDKYVSFSKGDKPGKRSYEKEDLEMDLHNISNTIKLLNEAINLWYDVYQNKKLVAEFSDGEIQEFRIKEGELAHLFGLIWSSLKNNDQLKQMGIVIPDRELNPDEKYEILLKITELYDEGNILQYEEERLKKLFNESHIYKIASIDHNFSYDKRNKALLPYPKINARTKAFIDYRPLDRLSLLLDFRQGVKIIKNDSSDVKNTILLSKNNLSDNFNWTGIVSTFDFDKKNNYMRSLLINSPDEYEKYMKKLSEVDNNGNSLAKASITTKIVLDSSIPDTGSSGSSKNRENNSTPSGGNGGSSGSSGGQNSSGGENSGFSESFEGQGSSDGENRLLDNIRIFTEEEQLSFICEVLDSFNNINLRDIIGYYQNLIHKFSKRK